MNTIITQVTQNIIERSKHTRAMYVDKINRAHLKGINRRVLGCSNLAHGCASAAASEKKLMIEDSAPNVGIITAYNDMLSAHEPFRIFPDIIKQTLSTMGATAQVAGGVPAMCDGVTQSQPGMELSLFSRDIIAQSTAIGLSHNMFDGVILLGTCDKIVPGLLIGALSFGHLPMAFIPAGPMTSGISNEEKAKTRQEFAIGNIGEKELLQSESASYHSPGTCTFYGTANSNQMLLEIMGLQLPGSSFVNTYTPLRDALTKAGTQTLFNLIDLEHNSQALGKLIDEKTIVNAVIGLLATGGSSNHTIHLIAIAKAAGIILKWEDFHQLATVIPLVAKLYPNGSADVNHFHALGGMPVVIKDLLDNGLLHGDVQTILGHGLDEFSSTPSLNDNTLTWTMVEHPNNDILATCAQPISPNGGLTIVTGNIGQGVIKTSALKPEHLVIEQPAEVFNSQEELHIAYQAGLLNKDFVAIVKYQGPKANGMPELHGLMPPLSALQDQGYKIAVITDGRMSGASGKVLSVVHVTPEALDDAPIGKIRSGDIVRIDVPNCLMEVKDSNDKLYNRPSPEVDLSDNDSLMGRELFLLHRNNISSADTGATIF